MLNNVAAIRPSSLERAAADIKAAYPAEGEALDRLLSHLERTLPMPAEIREAVCEFYCCVPSDLVVECREAEMALARQVYCYLAYRYTRLSFQRIGCHVGNRHHTTVMAAVRKIAKLVASRPLMADDIDLLRLRISEKVLARCARGRA